LLSEESPGIKTDNQIPRVAHPRKLVPSTGSSSAGCVALLLASHHNNNDLCINAISTIMPSTALQMTNEEMGRRIECTTKKMMLPGVAADRQKMQPYLAQLVQDMVFHAPLFKINPRRLDDILDDLLVHVADLCVRHDRGLGGKR
jgi:hypothetical protein